MNRHQAADILVVDDTVANLRLLTEILREEGHALRLARSGGLAMEAIRTAPPDLILLDINMPDMTGYEVCERLKADPQLADVPVIFLSALQETGDKIRAFQSGGVDYITKPFQSEEVLARVRTHLELRRQKQRLQENLEVLTRLERLRDNLTHMVVHDMRSPLTTIAAYLKLLESLEAASLSANGLRFITEARLTSERLIDTVTSMLDLSRLEAGELALKRSECDLTELAGSVLAGFEPLRGARRWTLDAPPQPVNIRADAALVSRVIGNLIGNAIKFTSHEGRIGVHISTADHAARVVVVDDGRGIAAGHRERIFDKFGQVESADARSGAGLGLFFCRLAVQLHGGSIGVESEEGKGSTFWFTLPL
jgi:signal transduction histidine kinase